MANSKYDIFISYRRDDGAQYARILQLELEKRGYRVFLDYEELTDGIFGDEIKEAVKDAPIFIMVLTPMYLARSMEENSWVREEITMAIDSGRHFIPLDPDKRFNGVPEGTPKNIADIVSNHQHSVIDFGQALGPTIDLMVKNRIKPHVTSSANPKKKSRPVVAIAACVIAVLAAIGVCGYFLLGSSEEKGQNYAKQYSNELLGAANADDKVAQYYMGLVMENGYGITADAFEAFKWYEKAARQGLDSAQVNLAQCYLDGLGVERDDSAALYWLFNAADQGNSDAMVNIGAYFYNEGREDEGTAWLKKALDMGNENAKRIMAGINGQTEAR